MVLESKRRSEYLKIFFLVFLAILFYFFTSLYLHTSKWLFLVIGGIVVLSQLFVFKGEYRIYSIIFYIPATNCMIVKGANIGSFLTWCIAVYFILCFIALLISYKKEQGFTYELKVTILFGIFAVFSFITQLVNIQTVSIIKYFSSLLYISIPMLFLIDNRAQKNIKTLIIVFALSHIISNLYAFLYLYILKDYSELFIETFIPNNYNSYIRQDLSDVRFPGLNGDSNHNSFYVLYSSSLIVLYLYRYKKDYIIMVLLLILLQIFALLGGSKTYIMVFAVSAIFAFITIFKNKKNFVLILIGFILSILFIFVIVLYIPSLSKVFLRLITQDYRDGFLESLSTYRISIWTTYLSEMMVNPFKLLIGHGLSAQKLLNNHYHNMFIQSLWELGIIGSLFLFLYYNSFFSSKKRIVKINSIYFLPILIILLFGLSLHILFEEGCISGLLIYYLIINDNPVVSRQPDKVYDIVV